MSNAFETPQAAEDAFYEAFETHDLDGMMSVWADREDVICVQPMGPILQGRDAIRQNWEQLFRAPQHPDITILHKLWIEDGGLAIHVVAESIRVEGMVQAPPSISATNVYQRGGEGWCMVAHHASPPPPPPGSFRP